MLWIWEELECGRTMEIEEGCSSSRDRPVGGGAHRRRPSHWWPRCSRAQGMATLLWLRAMPWGYIQSGGSWKKSNTAVVCLLAVLLTLDDDDWNKQSSMPYLLPATSLIFTWYQRDASGGRYCWRVGTHV